MNKKITIPIILILLASVVFAQKIVIEISDPEDENLYASLGDFLLEKGFGDAAVDAYQKSLELNPENKEIYNNLGIYYKDINPLLSEEYFLRSLDIDPKYKNARNNLALLYNNLKDYSNAAKQLSILVEMDASNIHYNYDYAVNLANKYRYESSDLNDLDLAIEHFKISYQIDPSFMYSLQNIQVLEEIKSLSV